MAIYVILLLFFFAVGLTCYLFPRDDRRHEKIFLDVTWIAIFVLCVLRASSVGRDLPGYEDAYYLTATVPWLDFDYVYFEHGYVFLMKLCCWLHMPFQGFLAVVSVIIMFPVYYFIRKHSSNYFLSTLVYVCYMFFEFNMTAVRQAMAASIVLLAYSAYISAKRLPRLTFALIVLLASLFHSGALVCLVFIPLSYIKRLSTYMVVVAASCVGLFFVRNRLMQIIKDLFEKDSMRADTGLYIGLNFLFTVGVMALFLISYARDVSAESSSLCLRDRAERGRIIDLQAQDVNIRLFFLGIGAMILFGSDTAARSYMMLSQVMIVQLPNCLEGWCDRDRRLMQMVLILFLCMFFFSNTLLPNSFDIVPYRFFWEAMA